MLDFDIMASALIPNRVPFPPCSPERSVWLLLSCQRSALHMLTRITPFQGLFNLRLQFFHIPPPNQLLRPISHEVMFNHSNNHIFLCYYLSCDQLPDKQLKRSKIYFGPHFERTMHRGSSVEEGMVAPAAGEIRERLLFFFF